MSLQWGLANHAQHFQLYKEPSYLQCKCFWLIVSPFLCVYFWDLPFVCLMKSNNNNKNPKLAYLNGPSKIFCLLHLGSSTISQIAPWVRHLLENRSHKIKQAPVWIVSLQSHTTPCFQKIVLVFFDTPDILLRDLWFWQLSLVAIYTWCMPQIEMQLHLHYTSNQCMGGGREKAIGNHRK